MIIYLELGLFGPIKSAATAFNRRTEGIANTRTQTMTSALIVILHVGILLILLNALMSKVLFAKQSFVFEEPLYHVPPMMSHIPPMVKFMLTFKVPRKVNTNESSEVSMGISRV